MRKKRNEMKKSGGTGGGEWAIESGGPVTKVGAAGNNCLDGSGQEGGKLLELFGIARSQFLVANIGS
jgi:hypothetical protein